MHKLNPKNLISITPIVPFRFISMMFPFLLLFTSACSTACQQHQALMTVLSEQSDVLKKLQAERASEPLASKIQKDATLSEAEAHLSEALRSLSLSNQVIQAALKN